LVPTEAGPADEHDRSPHSPARRAGAFGESARG